MKFRILQIIRLKIQSQNSYHIFVNSLVAVELESFILHVVYILYNLPIVCPKVFMQHVWTIFNKSTLTIRERSSIEIDERENIYKRSSLTHYHFSLRKIHWNKNRFLIDIYNGKCSHLLHSEVTLNMLI